jgi:hypothetical protein
MRGISWLAERTLSFLRRTLLHGVSIYLLVFACHRLFAVGKHSSKGIFYYYYYYLVLLSMHMLSGTQLLTRLNLNSKETCSFMLHQILYGVCDYKFEDILVWLNFLTPHLRRRHLDVLFHTNVFEDKTAHTHYINRKLLYFYCAA